MCVCVHAIISLNSLCQSGDTVMVSPVHDRTDGKQLRRSITAQQESDLESGEERRARILSCSKHVVGSVYAVPNAKD